MTIHHFTFLESFYDIFEFTSKLKQQEKQVKLKKGKHVTITEKRVTIWSSQETCIRHWWKRVTMEKTWHDYGNPNLGCLLHKAKTCHDWLKSCHDWLKSCHDFRSSCCLFKLKTILKTRVTNSGERKWDL